MRKVSRQAAEAFLAGKKRKFGKTETRAGSLWLHGNEIARLYRGQVYATLAGWPTRTTRERLNAVAVACGSSVRFRQQAGEQYAAGERIGSREWINLATHNHGDPGEIYTVRFGYFGRTSETFCEVSRNNAIRAAAARFGVAGWFSIDCEGCETLYNSRNYHTRKRQQRLFAS